MRQSLVEVVSPNDPSKANIMSLLFDEMESLSRHSEVKITTAL